MNIDELEKIQKEIKEENKEFYLVKSIKNENNEYDDVNVYFPQSSIFRFLPWTNKLRIKSKKKFNVIEDSQDSNCKRYEGLYVEEKSLVNLRVILENDDSVKGKIALNEFLYIEELKEDIELVRVKIKKGILEDNFTAAFGEYLDEQYFLKFSKSDIEDTVINVAQANSYNPLKDKLIEYRDYYNQSGETRDFSRVVTDYLPAEENEYHSLVTEKFLIGAVAKVFEPFTKFDYVMDLVGSAGTGKSTFFHKIFLGLANETIENFKDVDQIMKMVKSWAVIDNELVASKATGINKTKGFITQQNLEFRQPYGRKPIHRPKNFVIARTTNNLQHLTDKTGGDRRFWPVRIDGNIELKKRFSDLTEHEIKLLWGAVVVEYERLNFGNEFKLSDEEEAFIEKNKQGFVSTSSTDELIEQYLNMLLPFEFYDLTVTQRVSYVQSVISEGIGSYYRNNGEETSVVTVTEGEQRDRVNVLDMLEELLKKNDKNFDKKARMYFDQSEKWEKKSRVKFGKNKVTSGYTKKC